jgi:hypothetical protein
MWGDLNALHLQVNNICEVVCKIQYFNTLVGGVAHGGRDE